MKLDMPMRLIVVTLLFGGLPMPAQPLKLSGRTVWSHYWDGGFPTSATVDSKGALWITTAYQGDYRLLSFTPDGRRRSDIDLRPATPTPIPPATGGDWVLAALPSGVVGALIPYKHFEGRYVFSDGAMFATLNANGVPGPARRVAISGPRVAKLVALDDGNFLALGDQGPLTVIKISPTGEVVWQRTFSDNWVLPSAAALPAGGVCIVAPETERRVLQVLWLDKLGKIIHTAQLKGTRGSAAAHEGSCVILSAAERPDYHTNLSLTSFDAAFRTQWTFQLPQHPRSGGRLLLVALQNGYLGHIVDNPSGVLVRIASSGRILWSLEDKKIASVKFIVPFGDDYFLVGSSAMHGYALEITRAR
jgi:hypothetical protein